MDEVLGETEIRLELREQVGLDGASGGSELADVVEQRVVRREERKGADCGDEIRGLATFALAEERRDELALGGRFHQGFAESLQMHVENLAALGFVEVGELDRVRGDGADAECRGKTVATGSSGGR